VQRAKALGCQGALESLRSLLQSFLKPNIPPAHGCDPSLRLGVELSRCAYMCLPPPPQPGLACVPRAMDRCWPLPTTPCKGPIGSTPPVPVSGSRLFPGGTLIWKE
jgi:hypothetical protein